MTASPPLQVLLLLLVFCWGAAWGQDTTSAPASSDTGKEVVEEEDPVLPLEEAMAAIDEIAPLPENDPGREHDSTTLVLPEGEAPDFMFLRYLQIQERIKEKEDARVERERLVNEKFFSHKPDLHIYDPLQVLTESEEHVLDNLLTKFGKKSLNPIFVNLLTKDEVEHVLRVPHTSHEAALSDTPHGILIYYFYGAPENTKIYFGKQSFKKISYSKQQEFAGKALHEAINHEDSFNSIYRHLLSLTNSLDEYYKQSGLYPEKANDVAGSEEIPPKNTALSSQSSPIQEFLNDSRNQYMLIAMAVLIILLFLMITILLYNIKRAKKHALPEEEIITVNDSRL